MDLALLVYGISLLHGIGIFFVSLVIICAGIALANGIYWIDISAYRDDYEKKVVGIKSRVWKCFWVGAASAWMLILLPTEKTAYTMVGAYAAQKVAESDKVQQMSGKVLTIIEQKLDGYITDGLNEAQAKLDKAESVTQKEKKNGK